MGPGEEEGYKPLHGLLRALHTPLKASGDR
jgi:hypothetical protein